jgi:4-aminobutyrate aminotransferase/4-aminobutyrate aminotransferase/(S)-3-amino-2-methylpropionate transaminase
MGNGYPVSAIAAPANLMNSGPFGRPSASSSSYGGFPLACTAVASVTNVVRDQDLANRAHTIGAEFLALLHELIPETGIVGQIRGLGLAIGIELVSDHSTRTPLTKQELRRVFRQLLEKDVLVMIGGTSLRLYPPLTIDIDEMRNAAAMVASVLNSWTS